LLIAEQRGERELAEVWRIAAGFLDALSSKDQQNYAVLVQANSLALPSLPVTIQLGKTAPASCYDSMVWACAVILTIARCFASQLPADAEYIQRVISAQKIRHTTASILHRLAELCELYAEKCTHPIVASLLRSVAGRTLSAGVQMDLNAQLVEGGSDADLDTYTDDDILTMCASPYWYVKGQALVCATLAKAATVVQQVDDVCSLRNAHASLKLFARQLGDNCTAVVKAVKASPLFIQPSGNMRQEYCRLRALVGCLSFTAMSDWDFRQHCAAQLLIADAHRGTSEVHRLVADCWTQAVATMDSCLNTELNLSWDAAALRASVGSREMRKEGARRFTKLAGGLVNEVTGLHTAAANSANAGRQMAGDVWGEAAEVQLRLARYNYRSLVDAAPAVPATLGRDVGHMQRYLRKLMQLAPALDGSELSELSTRCHLLFYSRLHCKFSLAQQRRDEVTANSTVYEYPYTVMDTLYDLFLDPEVREYRALPTALQKCLAALEVAAGGHATDETATTATAWVPDALVNCSDLLFDVTKEMSGSRPPGSAGRCSVC
jgi:hypothetical protein